MKPYDRISITIPSDLNLKLKAMAAAEERSVSYIISRLVQKASGDPLVKEASLDATPAYIEYDTNEPSTLPNRSCPRCQNLGYACTAHSQ